MGAAKLLLFGAGWLLVAIGVARTIIAIALDEPVNDIGIVPGVAIGFAIFSVGVYAFDGRWLPASPETYLAAGLPEDADDPSCLGNFHAGFRICHRCICCPVRPRPRRIGRVCWLRRHDRYGRLGALRPADPARPWLETPIGFHRFVAEESEMLSALEARNRPTGQNRNNGSSTRVSVRTCLSDLPVYRALTRGCGLQQPRVVLGVRARDERANALIALVDRLARLDRGSQAQR